MVVTSKTSGNAEKSSGFSIHKETIKINMARENESAKATSSMNAGMGTNRIDKTAATASANPISFVLLVGTAVTCAVLMLPR